MPNLCHRRPWTSLGSLLLRLLRVRSRVLAGLIFGFGLGLLAGCETDLKVSGTFSGQLFQLNSYKDLNSLSGSGRSGDPIVFDLNDGTGKGEIALAIDSRVPADKRQIICESKPAFVEVDAANARLTMHAEQRHVVANHPFKCRLAIGGDNGDGAQLHFVANVTDINYAPTLQLATEPTGTATVQGLGDKDNPYSVELVAGSDRTSFQFAISDQDGDSIGLSCSDQPPWLTIAETGDKMTLAPEAEVPSGALTFSCVASDGTTSSNDAVYFSVTIKEASKPVVRNAVPTSANHTVTVAEDSRYTFGLDDFAFSDSDPGASLANIIITTLPAKGVLHLNGTALKAPSDVPKNQVLLLTYDPAPDEHGQEYTSFGFKVSDGSDASTGYTMTIKVTPVNDAPTAADAAVTIAENTQKIFVAADFNFADRDGGDGLQKVKITTLESAGALKLAGTDIALDDEILVASLPNLTFDPVANSFGANYASFGFMVSDGSVYSGAAYTMTIHVTDVSNPPTSADNTVTATEDTQLVFASTDFSFSDTDAGDVLTKIKITTLASAGTLKLSGSAVALNDEITTANIANLTFDPASDASGAPYATFGFQVSDGAVYSSSTYTMTINVTAVNDAPTSANNAVTILEDAQKAFASGDFSFADADNADSLTKIKITSLEFAGALKLSGTDVALNDEITTANIANLTFDPVADANGTSYATFGFQVSDGTAYSGSYTMTINVTAVNDAPTSANNAVTILEDAQKAFASSDFSFADVDSGDSLTKIKITSLESAGALKLSGTDVALNDEITTANIANLTFDPVADANGTPYATFGFQVSDGTAYSGSYTMTINVTAVNDAPTLTAVSDFSGSKNSPLVLSYADLMANGNEADAEGATLTIILMTSDSGTLTMENGAAVTLGTTTLTSGAAIKWLPATDATGSTAAFKIRVSDGTSDNGANVQVTVVVGDGTGAETIVGSSVGETLYGGYGGDTIDGGAGDDVIFADDPIFDPTTFTGQNSLWLDASDPATMTFRGNFITSWRDKSPNGLVFSQTDEALQPTWANSSLTGRKVVLNGTSHLELSNVAASTLFNAEETSIFLVQNNTNESGPNTTFAWRNSGTLRTLLHMSYATMLYWDFYNASGGRESVTRPAGWGNDVKIISALHYLNNTSRIDVNGLQLVTSSASATTSGSTLGHVEIGADGMNGSPFIGEISEFMFFKEGLSMANQEAIERFFSMKHGIDIGLTIGQDTLTGGAGADTFVWTNASHSGVGSGNRDIITDFNKADGDKISIVGFSEQIRVIGASAFSGDGYTELRWANLANNGGAAADETLVQIDWGGDGTADFEIEVRDFDDTTMAISDFIFSNAVGMTTADTMNGSSGNDTLVGGYHGDTLNGGAGDDVLIPDSDAFTRHSVSNVYAWYDALDPYGDGTVETDNSDIVTWFDKGDANGDGTIGDHNLSSVIAPTYNTLGLGGVPAMDFANGVDDEFKVAFGENIPAPNTIFIAGQIRTDGGNVKLFDGDISTSNRHVIYIDSGDYRLIGSSSAIGLSISLSQHVYRGSFTSSLCQLHLNNVQKVSADCAPTNLSGITLGRYAAGGTGIDALMSEVFIINGSLSTTETAVLQEYLAHKYASNLSGLTFGSDVMTGGTGADTFKITQGTYSPASARDRITDFNQGEGDKIDVSDFPGTFYFLGAGASSLISGYKGIAYAYSGGDTLVYIDSDGDGTAEIELILTGNIALVASDFSATGTMPDLNIAGTTGADSLVGGSGNDTITGGYDGDTITGGAGDDAIFPDDVPFSASTVSNLVTWFAASPSTLTKTAAGSVSQWQDLSGQNKHATQTGSANMPVYSGNGVAGRPEIIFDGNDDFLNTDGSVLVGTKYTVFVVGSRKDAAANYFFAGSGTSANNNLIFGHRDNGIFTMDQYSNAVNYTAGAFSSQALELWTGMLDTSSGRTLYFDGGLTAVASSGSTATLGSYAGASIGQDRGSNYLNGTVSEVMFFNEALTASNRQLVERYLSYRNNLSLSWGSFGNDTLTGGSGADTFTWTNASHSGVGSGNRDTITDFSQSDGDKIAFDGFIETIRVIGSAAFAGDGYCELRWYDDAGDAVVAIDWGGDGTADFEIELTGITHTDLTTGDFVFRNVMGTSSSDTVRGSSSSDTLVGGYGADTILGSAGDDHIYPDAMSLSRSTIPSLHSWFSALDPSGNGTMPSEGATLATWVNLADANQDGTPNDYPATALNSPAFIRSGTGGYPAIEFVKTDSDSFKTSAFSPTVPQPATFLVVAKTNLTCPSAEYKIYDGVAVEPARLLMECRNTQGKLSMNATNPLDHSVPDTVNGHFYTNIFNTTASSFLKDGGSAVGTNVGGWHSGGITMGSRYNNTDYFDGQISELMLFASRVSDSDLNTLHEYLSQKYQIAITGKTLGADTMTGGAGADTFYFTQGTYSPATARDAITDFNQGQGDKLDLTDFAGTVTFRAGGAGAGDFTGTVSQVAYSNDGTDTIVFVDIDGDGTAELEILLLNFTGTLTAADFNL